MGKPGSALCSLPLKTPTLPPQSWPPSDRVPFKGLGPSVSEGLAVHSHASQAFHPILRLRGELRTHLLPGSASRKVHWLE